MKKIAILLAAAMVFTLVAPAVAAPSLQLSGSLENKLTLNRDGFSGGGTFNLKLGLQAGDKTKAVVELAPWDVYAIALDENNPNLGNRTELLFKDGVQAIPLDKLSIRKAYVQTTGSFWTGGPEVTTTIGDMAINESQMVGDLGNRRGVKMEGIKLGPVSAEAFYAWPGGASRFLNWDADHEFGVVGTDASGNPVYGRYAIPNTDEVGGARFDVAIKPIQVGVNVIKSNLDTNPEYTIEGKVMPNDKLTVDGSFGTDAAQNQAYKVHAMVTNVIPSVIIHAGYRGADEGFAPRYATRADVDGSGAVEKSDWDTGVLAAHDRRTGYSVGLETTQAGVHMRGDYDDPKKEIKLAADTEKAGFKVNGEVKLVEMAFDSAKVTVEKPVLLPGVDLTAKYTGEMDSAKNLTHEIGGTMKVNVIPQLKDVTFNGKVELAGQNITDYEVGATYQAPNGIELGVSHSKTDGTSATAGLKVAF